MVGVAPGEAALDAGMAAIGLAVLVGDHAHQLLAAHLGLEAAADAAIGAGRHHRMLGLADLDDRLFSDSVAVGQACTQAPQDTHSELRKLSPSAPAETLDSKPRPWMVSAKVPCTSSQARTQREQTMHLAGSKVKYGLDSSFACLEVVLAVVAVAHVAQADGAGHVLQLAVAVGGAGQAVERMVGDVELHHALADLLQALGLGRHDHARRRPASCRRPACPPGPAISTRQSRQEPKASTESVAQSLGTWMPASMAARMIEVPAGTVTGWPSMVSVHLLCRDGWPACRSRFRERATWRCPLYAAAAAQARTVEVLGEMLDRAHHRVGREAAQRAERAEFQRLAEVGDQGEVGLGPLAADDLVHGLGAAHRADAAGRALAAGFDGAEFQREARLVRHVDRVVEHHDAAMADQPVAAPRRPRSRTACRTARAGNRRRAARRPARRAPAGRSACRRRYRRRSRPG